MNGHIGFNEPGVNPNSYCTIVPLDEITKSISVKYLKSISVKYFGEQLNIKYGVTVGFKHFMESNEVFSNCRFITESRDCQENCRRIN